jgi:hypothetical protein
MTTKQDSKFLPEDCMEMMSQMISKNQQGAGDACAEMMSQFVDPESSGSKFFETMSQMMVSCCSIQEKDDQIIKKA